MSKIANLHSLLSSKWLIEQSAANSLIPDLIRLIRGEAPIEVQQLVPSFASIAGDYWDEDEDDEYEDSTIEKNTIVAVLPIRGTITKYSQWCGPMGTRTMREYMDRWKNDDSIAAVVLDIDSGGGQVSGTAEFADYVHSYPKPVVAYTDGMICSAAYWIAAASNEIWANEYSEEIGSIGTMCKALILDGIIEKEGGKIIEEYATKSSLKNHAWRELKKGNVQPLIKETLDPINERFHAKVKEYRPGLSEATYTGIDYLNAQTSLSEGLIDSIGTKKQAIDRAFELANNSNSNFNNMSDNNQGAENSYSKLAAVLGIEVKTKAGIFFGSKSVSLTEEQLDRLEAALPDPEESNKIADLQSQLTTAQTAQSAAENKVTVLDSAVAAALTKAGLTSEKKATSAENIDFLAKKVVEYGGSDGGNPTDVHAEKDPIDPINTESTSIFDSIAN